MTKIFNFLIIHLHKISGYITLFVPIMNVELLLSKVNIDVAHNRLTSVVNVVHTFFNNDMKEMQPRHRALS